MGFERIIGIAAALALLPSATAALAAPGEPLVVTELPDASLVPLSSSGGRNETADDPTARFSLAIAQALASDQQMKQQACQASRPPEGSDAIVRYQWQARCLYQRR